MPLPKPSLDNRTFDQLVSETRAVLAHAAPDWTDHNVSDPGITLLELAAWLGEQNIYRLDRPSEATRRAFVRLIGIEPRAAGVARGVVALDSTVDIDLPARIQLSDARAPVFETTAPVFASAARLVRIATRAVDGTRTLHPVDANPARGMVFAPFGEQPRTGTAFELGFDRPLDGAAATLSLYIWTAAWECDAATRAALIAECSTAGSPDWRKHYRVATQWEYWSAQGWQALGAVDDETRALSLSGFVRLRAPSAHARGDDGLFPVRCRIVSGRHECAPRLAHVAFNAVPCEHALTRAATALGRSRGWAGARFAIGEAPVVAGSTALTLIDGHGATQSGWQEQPDWDRAGAHDRIYRLDAARGEIEGGDGLRGAILPAGFDLSLAYRHGGGSEGNLAPATLTTLDASAVNLALAPALAATGTALKVRQPFAMSGGTPAETVEQAQARAFAAVSAVDKAVTVEDIERIALATPGVPVARVCAVAGHDPALPCYAAPGVVSVVVIPFCPSRRPMPSQAMLDAVHRYLAPRRLVTSEIRTLPPRYRRVSVSATLHLACGALRSEVERSALARLDAFLNPLTGGPQATGWPFGRAVYRNEVLALLAGIAGVERVSALALAQGYGSPGCDNVLLCADELVTAGRHRLQFEGTSAPNLRRSQPHECNPA